MLIKRLKPYLRWFVLGATVLFLLQTLHNHWQGVLSLRLAENGLALLLAALAVTLAAHVWSGWVWSWLLRGLLRGPDQGPDQGPDDLQIPKSWAIATYLRTNLAKYLPGNIWHFYGRLQACQTVSIPLPIALLSIVLEPLLMAAAALLVASVSYPGWQTLALLPILIGIHPRFLNPLLQRLARGKLATLGRRVKGGLADPGLDNEALGNDPFGVQLQRYPLGPLGGELVFVLLRGMGFWLALGALGPLRFEQMPLILGAFSLAWVLGLVVPGAPGGVGVFEGVAIALLQVSLTPERILGAVAAYRLVSTLAEVLGAAVGAWMGRDRPHPKPPLGF